jgi:fructose/tagatose bisphosphate aldolase
MPVTPLSVMLAEARSGAYALSYAESWNLESLQAVIDAAEKHRSPIIAGFNGGFLRHAARKKPENLAYYACFRKALERAKVSVAFLLNESDSLEQIREGIDLGFNAVMPESENLGIDDYRDLVNAVVAIARPRGVWVEAQFGTLPVGVERNGHGMITDPDLAAEFVEDTGIDALAVSVGNVHILTEGQATVNLDILRRIRERVSVPLVIHGGTSLAPGTVREMTRLGVAKVNFGTVLKQAYLEAVRTSLAKYHVPSSPHEFLGIGGPEDVMTAGREAVERGVERLIEVCGSKGRGH